VPARFESCRKAGGKIRTKKLSGGRYQPVCYIGGQAFEGEIHKKKEKK